MRFYCDIAGDNWLQRSSEVSDEAGVQISDRFIAVLSRLKQLEGRVPVFVSGAMASFPAGTEHLFYRYHGGWQILKSLLLPNARRGNCYLSRYPREPTPAAQRGTLPGLEASQLRELQATVPCWGFLTQQLFSSKHSNLLKGFLKVNLPFEVRRKERSSLSLSFLKRNFF